MKSALVLFAILAAASSSQARDLSTAEVSTLLKSDGISVCIKDLVHGTEGSQLGIPSGTAEDTEGGRRSIIQYKLTTADGRASGLGMILVNEQGSVENELHVVSCNSAWKFEY